MQSIDFSKDQHLFSIRRDSEEIGGVEIVGGELTTYGQVGEGNTYPDFVALLKGLQGFNISLEDLFFNH